MAAEENKLANATDNWCVILQSYPSKKKKDIIKHLAEAFGLEHKDAEAALSSTPLILLDALSFAIAGRMKDFFRKIGAVAEITNHDMIKKNCYQIVWSARPDLSAFLQPEPAQHSEVPAAAKGPELPKGPANFAPAPKPPAAVAPAASPSPAAVAPRPPRKSVFDRFREADQKKQETQKFPGKPPAQQGQGMTAPQTSAAPVKKEDEKDLSARAPVAGPVKGDPAPDVSGTVKPEDAVVRDAVARETESLRNRADQMDRKIRDFEGVIGQKENHIKDLERALEVARATEVESVARMAKLQQRISDLERGVAEKHAEHEGSQSALEGQNARVAELDRVLSEKMRETDVLRKSLQELHANGEELQRRADGLAAELASKDRALADQVQENQGVKGALQELQSKESELLRHADEIGRILEEKDRSLSALGQETEGLKHALQELQTRETGSAQRADSLAHSVDELNQALRHNEETLKARDERIAALEQRIADLTAQDHDFEKIRQEYEQLSAERSLIRQEYDAKFSEQEVRIAKIEEEGRRYRSRTERKNAAATRELGEWIRGIESLRQGLQKLIHFIGSDAAVQDPDKTTLRVGGVHRNQKPPEHPPQQS